MPLYGRSFVVVSGGLPSPPIGPSGRPALPPGGPGNRKPPGSEVGRTLLGKGCPSKTSESDGSCRCMLYCSRGGCWVSPWLPGWVELEMEGNRLCSFLTVGEMSLTCRSASRPAGDIADSSGGAVEVGGPTWMNWVSFVDTEPTLCREHGGSLPRRLSAPLPLRLVRVGVALGLTRLWLWFSSLTRLDVSLSRAARQQACAGMRRQDGQDQPCEGEGYLALNSRRYS